jgi:hypothetical protein
MLDGEILCELIEQDHRGDDRGIQDAALVVVRQFHKSTVKRDCLRTVFPVRPMKHRIL